MNCIMLVLLLSCEKSDSGEALLGIWNNGKITNDKYYTIPDYEKHYKVIDGYIVIEKDKKYKGVIYDLSETLYITSIGGKYPIYNLSVMASYMGLENGIQIEKWRYGTIIVHFIDKNTIWFENNLSQELNYLLEIRHFSLNFGIQKLFYRAEQVDKPIHRDPSELQ